MKQVIVAGNWKSNKTIAQAHTWVDAFAGIYTARPDHATIILCAPFTLLYLLKQELDVRMLPIKLGAQMVSPFDDGAYTGEISAHMLAELVSYVIIGHTERRKYFGETDEQLAQQVQRAKEAGLTVIYCVNDEQMSVPSGVDILSYEPAWAIGTGKADTPDHVNTVMGIIKQKTGVTRAIYGGSVTAENVASYIRESNVDGVLPGGASLDPAKFAALITAACS